MVYLGSMQRNVELEATIVAKYAAVSPVLDERSRRRWAAAESVAIGYGGDALVSSATGLARETIRKGRREITQGGTPTGRIRRPGARRPRLEQRQPGLLAALEGLVDPLTRGDPTSPLRWTCKSRAKLASGLAQQGWRVSSTTVGRLLYQLGYRLQSARGVRADEGLLGRAQKESREVARRRPPAALRGNRVHPRIRGFSGVFGATAGEARALAHSSATRNRCSLGSDNPRSVDFPECSACQSNPETRTLCSAGSRAGCWPPNCQPGPLSAETSATRQSPRAGPCRPRYQTSRHACQSGRLASTSPAGAWTPCTVSSEAVDGLRVGPPSTNGHA